MPASCSKFVVFYLCVRRSEKAETSYIPAGDSFVWKQLGAITYFAILAYPAPTEWSKRDVFVEHMKGLLFKRFWGPPGSPGRAARRRQISRKYSGMRWKRIEEVCRAAHFRIEKRYFARQLAWDMFIHHHLRGLQWEWPRLGAFRAMPPGRVSLQFEVTSRRAGESAAKKRLGRWHPENVTALFEKFATLFPNMDESSFRKRIWRPSLPVLHLAMAIPEDRLEKADWFISMLRDPSWVAPALLNAERLRVPLPDGVSGFSLKSAIRLLPTES